MQENPLHFVSKINDGIWGNSMVSGRSGPQVVPAGTTWAESTWVLNDLKPIVWDPYTTSDINKLERIQRRAARFITGDYKTRRRFCHQDAQRPKVREPSTEENKLKTGIPVQGG